LLVAAAVSRGHTIEFVDPRGLVCSTNTIPAYDVIISRAELDKFTENITDAYLRALDYFETLGVPVINSCQATMNAQDKFRTLLLVQNAGVPIPLTFLVHELEDIHNLLNSQQIKFPIFIKKPYGGCGTGVFLAQDSQMLDQIISQNFQSGDPILVEERIDLETDENGNVKDMRIWVVRDSATNKAKFVGGASRTASNGNYLTNVHAGGTVSDLNLQNNRELIRFSEMALESIGADVAGIDLARDKNGNLYLLEINISFYTDKLFKDIIGINIWELVLDLAEARVKANRH